MKPNRILQYCLSILSAPFEPVEQEPAKCVPSIGLLCNSCTLIYICQLDLRVLLTTGQPVSFIHDRKKNMPSKSKELDEKFPEGYWKKKIHGNNECISYSNFTYLLNNSSEYIKCVFYIAVFGMLVWGISTNAPNKGCPRLLHQREIPISWLTGSLLAVATCACYIVL